MKVPEVYMHFRHMIKGNLDDGVEGLKKES